MVFPINLYILQVFKLLAFLHTFFNLFCYNRIYFLRYEDKYYLTDARIEIIEDSKDSDVSLFTELTILIGQR